MNRISALLFDLDGTLIDSMPHHHNAWVEWYARRGLPMNAGQFFAATAGRSNAEILLDLFPDLSVAEHAAMADAKEAIYRELAAGSLACAILQSAHSARPYRADHASAQTDHHSGRSIFPHR